MQPIQSPWLDTFSRLVARATESVLLCSPFISQEVCNNVINGVEPERRQIMRVQILTDLSLANVASGLIDVAALVSLSEAFGHFGCRSLPKLHAKVYVFDEVAAVVTSAN